MTYGMQARIGYMREKLRHELDYLEEELADPELDDEEAYYLKRDIEEVEYKLSLLTH